MTAWRSDMPHDFRVIRRVEFADTDMAGVMHFANFFRFMEATEHEFFRSLGLSIRTEEDGRVVGWPRVKASCEYKSPLRFEDEVEVHLIVREKKERSLAYDFIFRKLDGFEVARGSITAVCATLDEQAGKMKSIPIPAAIASRIEVAPQGIISSEGD